MQLDALEVRFDSLMEREKPNFYIDPPSRKSQFIHTISFLGAAGIAVGYPLDTVKVRIQTQDISKGVKYRGTFQCLATIMREEGVRIEICSIII